MEFGIISAFESSIEAGIKSTANSSVTPIDSGSTWNGESELCGYNDIFFDCETGQDGEITLEVSQDNTNWTFREKICLL